MKIYREYIYRPRLDVGNEVYIYQSLSEEVNELRKNRYLVDYNLKVYI